MEVVIFPALQKSKNRVCYAVKCCQSKANKDLIVILCTFLKPGDRSVSIETFFLVI